MVGRGSRRSHTSVGGGGAEPLVKEAAAREDRVPGAVASDREDGSRRIRPIEVGSAGASPHHFDKVSPRRGFLLSPYSPATERMAWGQARLLRKYNPDIPVLIYAQDYVPTLPWKELAEVQTARGCHSGKDDLRWLNKLEAICDAPFGETIFFDCDMMSTGPVSGWFEALATDDVSFWHHLRTRENSPDGVTSNLLNPHRFCPHYGVAGVPTMLGGGHYYVRKSLRSQAILDRVAAIMVEAMENPRALYWDFAGSGNIVGDEPAASMAVVEMGIQLPPPCRLGTMPVGASCRPGKHGGRRTLTTVQCATPASGPAVRCRPRWCISRERGRVIRYTMPGWRSAWPAGPESHGSPHSALRAGHSATGSWTRRGCCAGSSHPSRRRRAFSRMAVQPAVGPRPRMWRKMQEPAPGR